MCFSLPESSLHFSFRMSCHEMWLGPPSFAFPWPKKGVTVSVCIQTTAKAQVCSPPPPPHSHRFYFCFLRQGFSVNPGCPGTNSGWPGTQGPCLHSAGIKSMHHHCLGTIYFTNETKNPTRGPPFPRYPVMALLEPPQDLHYHFLPFK